MVKGKAGYVLLALLLVGAAGGAPPIRPRFPVKPTAPIALDLRLLRGGQPGGRAVLLLEAHPLAAQGRLDLDIALPQGLKLISGATASSDAGPGGRRVLDVEVEVPDDGVYEVLGRAVLTLPGGARYARARILTLPLGRSKPVPAPPLVPYQGGQILEAVGEGGP